MDELPDRKGVLKVKVCVSLPQRAEIVVMRYDCQLEVMRDFVTWEQSLHIQCCTVCGVMVVADLKGRDCVSLGQTLVNPRIGGAADAQKGDGQEMHTHEKERVRERKERGREGKRKGANKVVALHICIHTYTIE